MGPEYSQEGQESVEEHYAGLAAYLDSQPKQPQPSFPLSEIRGEPDMQLPSGKACGDCAHHPRCVMLFGCPGGNTVCDWSPSRFQTAAGRQLLAQNEEK